MKNTYYQDIKKELERINPEDFNNKDNLVEYLAETIPLKGTDTDEQADIERDKLLKDIYKAINEM